MNTIVNQLLEIDREARLILDEAQQYYDKTIEELAAEKKSLMDKYEEKKRLHLEGVQNAECAQSQEAAAEISRQYAALTKNLETVYAENHEKWEDGLFQRCVGR